MTNTGSCGQKVALICHHDVSRPLPPFIHFCNISICLPLFSILRRAHSKIVHRPLICSSSGEAPVVGPVQEGTGDSCLSTDTDIPRLAAPLSYKLHPSLPLGLCLWLNRLYQHQKCHEVIPYSPVGHREYKL